MASRAKTVKTEMKVSGNEKYLNDIFKVIRRVEALTLVDKKARFNGTELRLISEVLAAKYAGKRLISTQLAKLLGVTRSAISQIVNRLEAEGVVVRVADEIDRKIAYIEITDTVLEAYGKDLKCYADFAGRIVTKFGEERFDEMCELFNSFCDLVEEESSLFDNKRKYQRRDS